MFISKDPKISLKILRWFKMLDEDQWYLKTLKKQL